MASVSLPVFHCYSLSLSFLGEGAHSPPDGLRFPEPRPDLPALGRSCVAGMWWSVVHNKLSPADLSRLREAWPQFQWAPLVTVIGEYALQASDSVPEPLSTGAIAGYCRHPGVAAGLMEAYATDAYIVRRVLNGQVYPPARGGCSPALALLAFYSAGPLGLFSCPHPPAFGFHIGRRDFALGMTLACPHRPFARRRVGRLLLLWVAGASGSLARQRPWPIPFPFPAPPRVPGFFFSSARPFACLQVL